MKWTNKGHEFDELGNIFQNNKDLLFLGDLDKAKIMEKLLDFLNAKIIIAEDKKYIDICLEGKTILIFGEHPEIENYLISKGLKLNINYFLIPQLNTDKAFLHYANEFLEKYLSIFAVYAYNKVYIHSNNIVITTKCNLNCRDCLNYTPYNDNKSHIDISKLKEDVDFYFKNVDKVAFFHVTGGEPTLHPYLKELIEYINDNYRDKIIDFATVTNGIKNIDDSICKVYENGKMVVQIDTYLSQVPQFREVFYKNLDKLKNYEIFVDILGKDEGWDWFITYPPRYDYSTLSENELRKRFDYCGCIYSTIKDKGIYFCNYHSFAETAGIVSFDEDSFFDLSGEVNKKALIEFRLKYNNKGYVEFCKKCNGFYPLNLYFVDAGIQTKEKLKWDGTFSESEYIPVDILKLKKELEEKEYKLSVQISVLNDRINNLDAKSNDSCLRVDYLTFAVNKLIDTIAWMIPLRKLRDKFRNSLTRPDQTRPDQTRPDQTRPST